MARYYSSNFRSHEKSDKKKWAVTAVALLLIAAVLVSGILTNWYTEFNKFCWFGHTYDENGICIRNSKHVKLDEIKPDNGNVSDAVERGGMLASVSEQAGIELLAVPMSASEDIPVAVAANSYSLTATIKPESADNQTVDWSIAWKNASSTWAQGRSVTDYVMLTPIKDGALTATVFCKQAFGEQIIVTVKSRDNANASATCTVDYVKRITDLQVSLSNTTAAFNTTYTVTTTPVFGVGTLEGTFSVNGYSMILADNIKTALTGIEGPETASYSENGDYYRVKYVSVVADPINFNMDLTEQTFSFAGSSAFYAFSDRKSGFVHTRNSPTSSNFGDNRSSAESYAWSQCASLFENAFKQAINAEDGNHLTFTLSYSYEYAGTTAGQTSGTADVGMRFDPDSFIVQVTGVSLNHTGLFF